MYFNTKWKDETRNFYYVVPGNARPFVNGSSSENYSDHSNQLGSGVKNPIKHWRKQLMSPNLINSNQVSIDHLNHGTFSSENKDSITSANNCSKLLHENLKYLSQCSSNNWTGIKDTDRNRCIGGANHITRRGIFVKGNANNEYYQNTNSYLTAKCKTFEKNSVLGSYSGSGNEYDSTCYNCDKKIISKTNPPNSVC